MIGSTGCRKRSDKASEALSKRCSKTNWSMPSAGAAISARVGPPAIATDTASDDCLAPLARWCYRSLGPVCSTRRAAIRSGRTRRYRPKRAEAVIARPDSPCPCRSPRRTGSTAETVCMLFRVLLACGQITLRRVDGWHTLHVEPDIESLNLAA